MKKLLAVITALTLSLVAVPMTTAFALPIAENINAKTAAAISPSGLFLNGDGTLLITDLLSKSVYSQKGGVLTRLTGSRDIFGVDGVPVGGYVDGDAKIAQFSEPWGIAPRAGGYAITDAQNHAVRLLKDGKVSTISANFKRPTGIAAGENGSLYVADTATGLINKIDSAGKVTAFAGGIGCSDGELSEARFREPTGLCYKDGALYVADTGNHRICKIENGIVTTIAGFRGAIAQDVAYDGGFVDGAVARAQLCSPQGIAVSNGIIYVADTGNSAIRTISNGAVATLSQRTDGALYPVSPRSLVIGGATLTYGDVFSNGIFTVDTKLAASVPAADSETFYTVVKGDTLSEIAAANSTTVKALVAFNKIKDPNFIVVGQRIRIK